MDVRLRVSGSLELLKGVLAALSFHSLRMLTVPLAADTPTSSPSDTTIDQIFSKVGDSWQMDCCKPKVTVCLSKENAAQ